MTSPTSAVWPNAQPLVRGKEPPALTPARDQEPAASTDTPRGVMPDAKKLTLTVRDLLLLLVGCGGMFAAQLGVQAELRSGIRDVNTKLDAYQASQAQSYNTLQRQIDELRQNAKLNEVNERNDETELAVLKGLMMASGIKGVTLPTVKGLGK